MMRSICGRIFILICSAMFELLPFFDVFMPFLMFFLSKIFSDTTGPIVTKLDRNVPWGILHRTDVGIMDLSKNHDCLYKKIEHKGQTVVFLHIMSPNLLGLGKFF